ncbi:MAG: PQQ-binding-like beta-propeller repeat protein [Ardenticatenaceae bacterium]|nr:PQQ-binding-like beta-propeller repeat protein [Ardenticatenaceae bacterium]
MKPSPAGVSTPTDTLSSGTLLAGRYHIEQVIGAGGMGAVYVARDRRFRAVMRRCAVKEMFDQLPDVAARQQAHTNFEREANILASLSHPAIPKVFDFFTEGERHYLVMEYIEGQDLDQVRRQYAHPFDPAQILEWAFQLCAVLSYLHAQKPPIIFRDLKPSNIVRRTDRRLALVDFGIAKHFQIKARGTMVGTEGYAPPEQYEGAADPRVDIYSLGATLHHLLTNTDPQEFRPFSFASRPIRQYNPAVPPDLEAAIMVALAYDPEERWATVTDLEAALRTLDERTPLRDGTGPPVTRPQHLPESLDERGPAGRPTVPIAANDRPVLPAASNDDQTVVPVWRFQCEEEVRSSPAVVENRLFIGSYDHNLYCLDSLSGRFRWKFATGGGIPGTPHLYNQFVIVGSEDRVVYAVQADSGRLEWSFPTQGRLRSSPRIAYDHVFIGSDDGHVYAINALRGWQLWKTNIGSPVRSSAAISEKIVIIGSEDAVLYALDLLTGEVRWRVRTNGGIVSSPGLENERVVVGSLDWTVYGIDPGSGWVVWRFRTADMVISSPAIAGNRVYIGSADRTVTCLDIDWGKVHWRQRVGGQVTSSPAVANGYVYIGCVDGALYCLNARSGQIVWRFQTGGPIPGSPMVAGGMVYIGSMDHYVYALPAADSP